MKTLGLLAITLLGAMAFDGRAEGRPHWDSQDELVQRVQLDESGRPLTGPAPTRLLDCREPCLSFQTTGGTMSVHNSCDHCRRQTMFRHNGTTYHVDVQAGKTVHGVEIPASYAGFSTRCP